MTLEHLLAPESKMPLKKVKPNQKTHNDGKYVSEIKWSIERAASSQSWNNLSAKMNNVLLDYNSEYIRKSILIEINDWISK